MQISRVLIYVFFFGSGFAALLYQVVWLKYLNLLFGSTTYATAAVVAAFMFGLSFGSQISVRIPKLFSASLKTYGFIEIGIGLFAVTFPYLYAGLKIPFAWIFNLIGPQTTAYNLLIFVVAFLVLLVPTAFMGATLPLLSHYLIQSGDVPQSSGKIYAVNTAGAVAGVLCSAFILIPTLGLTSTVYVGVLLNTIIGAICYFAAKNVSSTSSEKPASKRASIRDAMLWMYGISGMLAISYEVLWTRLLVLHLGNSVYAYAIMLAVFLVGISLGSFVSGKWMAKARYPVAVLFSAVQIAWAFSIVLQVLQFTRFSSTLVWIAEIFGAVTVGTQFVILLLGALQLLLLPTFLSGALFPAVVTHLWKNGSSVADAVAQSYSVNTIGGIAGSIVAAFLLIPIFGTQASLFVLAAGNILLGLTGILVLAKGVIERKIFYASFAAVLIFAIGSWMIHHRVNVIRSAKVFQTDAENELLHLEEDPTATITVEKRTQHRKPYRSLSVNGVNVAGTSPDLFAIQKMQAHIPVLLYGPLKEKQILHIGFGSGGTAYSASLYPNSKITVVEIARGVVRNADLYFKDVNHGVVSSPKIQFIYFDGRSYLQNTRKTYDIILSDSIHPRFSGNGSLYTRDYYELVYSRLNPNGVHSQWIPIYSVAQHNLQQILKAFEEVFDSPSVWYINSTINAYIVVTGRKGRSGIQLQNFHDAYQIPEVAHDLQSISTSNEIAVLDHFLFGEEGLKKYTANVEPHTDDRLSVEYESSRIVNRQLSWWLNFRDLIRYREQITGYLTSPAGLNRVNYERFYHATQMNLIGQLYFVGGDREKAKKAFADAARKNDSDREPVEYYQQSF